MRAEIVSIGDEMTSGQRLDTNSRWLSQQLADLGVVTVRHTTIADDLQANIDVFATAASRAEIVISTGGLGPTLDDLTRDALSAAFQRPLELDAHCLAHIEGMFAQRKRPMPERNRIQAMMPQGTIVIPNPHGTAPGIELVVPGPAGAKSHIYALPGVPAEMVEMWHQTLKPRIENLLGNDRMPQMFHTIKLFGVGESDVEVQLPDLMRRDRVPRVGITVSRATISLRIVAQARSDEEFWQAIQPTVDEIHAALGVLIFGTGEDELEDAILRQLRERGQRLAVLEIGPDSLVGGWLLSACTPAECSAESGPVGSLACSSVGQAQRILGVPHSATATNSRDQLLATLPELAEAVRRTLHADIGLAFGTYATRDELLQSRPATMVDVAIAGEGLVLPDVGAGTPSSPSVRSRPIIGHPDILNDRVAKTALDTLRLAMLKGKRP